MKPLFQLSEAVQIGIYSVALIARSGKKMNIKEIAGEISASEHHLSKVMQMLVKAGIADSVRGPSGGFTILKPLKQIHLIDIYEAIEGKIAQTQCPNHREKCPFDHCLFQDLNENYLKKIENFFRSQTIDGVTKNISLKEKI